MYSTSEDIAM